MGRASNAKKQRREQPVTAAAEPEVIIRAGLASGTGSVKPEPEPVPEAKPEAETE
jgi:hypothetical protein